MSRVKLGGRRFREAVELEIAHRRLAEPIGYRILTVDFEARTIDFDRGPIEVRARCITIPILSTDHPILPR